MPTFKITTKEALNVQGEYVGAGLSVQVTTTIPYFSHNVEKVQNAFLRIFDIDFIAAGYLNPGYFNVEEV